MPYKRLSLAPSCRSDHPQSLQLHQEQDKQQANQQPKKDERDRERDRERERERERETERQRDRERDRERQRKIERDTDNILQTTIELICEIETMIDIHMYKCIINSTLCIFTYVTIA